MRSPASVLDDTARRLHRLVEPIHGRAGAWVVAADKAAASYGGKWCVSRVLPRPL